MTEKKEIENLPVFEPQNLIKAGPAVFNVMPEVMAGALYGITERLTIDQAKEKLKVFLAKSVNNEGGI